MILQHNIQAMNTNRQLNITSSNLAKDTEKISSGFKINRSADDAAGLSISEKMRKQIRGLTRATANIEDGVSLCRVADGAMNEMQDMIHRMNELCIKAANETNSETDRNYIQMEIDQIVTECDRIINTTKFNDLYIFKGNESMILDQSGIDYQQIGIKDRSDTAANGTSAASIDSVAGITAYTGGNLGDNFTFDNTYIQSNNTTYSLTYGKTYACGWVDFSGLTAGSAQELNDKLNDKGFDSSCAYCDTKFYGIRFSTSEGKNSTSADGISYTYSKQNATGPNNYPIISEVIKLDIDSIWNYYNTKHAADSSYTLGEAMCFSIMNAIDSAATNPGSNLNDHFTSYAYIPGNAKLYVASNQGNHPGSSTFSLKPRNDLGLFDDDEDTDPKEPVYRLVIHTELENEETSIQAGSESERTNKVHIDLPTMSVDSLRINAVCALTTELATESIDILNYALKELSTHRSRMGAYENRLEHADKNLSNVVENTTASESQIRDTDMSKQMVSYSNNQILQQAGQAMLSQANRSKDGILSLIQ